MAVKPPLIGLPGRRKRASEMAGLPEVFDDRDVDLYFADYARGVIEAGGIPVHLPIDVDPAAVGERLDGIVLPGGTDIDPVRYGADPHPELLTPEQERDDLELGLLSAALDADIPVLGICRGIQIVNVHQGGTLHQHVPEHGRFDLPSRYRHPSGELRRGIYPGRAVRPLGRGQQPSSPNGGLSSAAT